MMNAILKHRLLAATSDSGVLLHDILGGLALAVLLVIGIFFYRRRPQRSDSGLQRPGDTNLDRAFGRVQVWVLYCVAVAAVVVFFFVMPRATRQKGEATPSQNGGTKELP